MSKSKRDRNYRKEEARYTDGPKKTVNAQKQRNEKKVKNLFRSNDIDGLLEAEMYK